MYGVSVKTEEKEESWKVKLILSRQRSGVNAIKLIYL